MEKTEHTHTQTWQASYCNPGPLSHRQTPPWGLGTRLIAGCLTGTTQREIQQQTALSFTNHVDVIKSWHQQHLDVNGVDPDTEVIPLTIAFI